MERWTDEGRDVFAVWMGDGRRDVQRTAGLVGLAPSAVRRLAETYDYRATARDLDATHAASMVQIARRTLADALPGAAEYLAAAASGSPPKPSHGRGKGGKVEGAINAQALRATLSLLAMFGLAPVKRGEISIMSESTSDMRTDPSLVAELVEAGDVPALIALASGQALPVGGAEAGYAAPGPYPGGVPGDFRAGRPSGRVGRAPSPPVLDHRDIGDTVEGSYRVMSDDEWDAEQRRQRQIDDILDFKFGEQP